MAYLVVTIKGKELCRQELNGPVTLGRSTDCDLWVNEAGVSRRHCRFERNGEAWEVHDLGSRNGVVLHGERITKHTLGDGDSIHVGAARIMFHALGYVTSRPARPSVPQGPADSVSDTVMSPNGGSRTGRLLPTPRARMPGQSDTEATNPTAPLAFTRPPARPMPAASRSVDENGKSDREHQPRREGLLRRFLHR